MGFRQLLVPLLAVGVVAVIALALLMSRGASSSGVAAAHAEATAPKPSPSAGSQTASAPRQKWSSENSADWVGNRRNAAAFELPAENTVAVWLQHVRPALVVRCLSNSTEVFVLTGSAIKMEPDTDDHTVTFGFDQEPELTQRWPDAAAHDALFAPDGAAFAERLTRARTLRFGYTPHNAMPVVAQFHVSGIGELLAPVAKACSAKK